MTRVGRSSVRILPAAALGLEPVESHDSVAGLDRPAADMRRVGWQRGCPRGTASAASPHPAGRPAS